MVDIGTAAYATPAEIVLSNAASAVLMSLPSALLGTGKAAGASLPLNAGEAVELIGLGKLEPEEELWLERALKIAEMGAAPTPIAALQYRPATPWHFELASKILDIGKIWHTFASQLGNEDPGEIGSVEDLIELGRRWGVDYAIEAYLAGAPLEHVVGEIS